MKNREKKISIASILGRVFLFPLLIFGLIMKLYDKMYGKFRDNLNRK